MVKEEETGVHPSLTTFRHSVHNSRLQRRCDRSSNRDKITTWSWARPCSGLQSRCHWQCLPTSPLLHSTGLSIPSISFLLSPSQGQGIGHEGFTPHSLFGCSGNGRGRVRHENRSWVNNALTCNRSGYRWTKVRIHTFLTSWCKSVSPY